MKNKNIHLDDNSIITAAIANEDIAVKPLDEYTPEELRILAECLISLCRDTILGESVLAKDLQETLDALNFSAHKDSRCSSMKPSSDICRQENETEEEEKNTERHLNEDDDNGEENAEAELRKDHDRSLRERSDREVGKMKGEKGYGFKTPDYSNVKEVTLFPPKCENCPHKDECLKNAKTGVTHNEFDVEIIITKTTYKTPEMVCPESVEIHKPNNKDEAAKPHPNDKENRRAEFPEDLKGVNQYGKMIRTIVCLMYCVGMVSLNRIRGIISPMLGIGLSESTMLNYIHNLSQKVSYTVDSILDAERNEKVVHCDETGAKVNGTINWIHCVSTELYTFVSLQEKRGKDAIDAIGFLATYVGTVVHDCWASYWKVDEENGDLVHAICGAHIQRELIGLSKFFKNASKWADDMLSLLQEMVHEKHLFIEKGLSSMPEEKLRDFSRRYDEIIQRGKELHPLPQRKEGQRGRLKRGRARCLVDRMESKKDDILRFLTDFKVPYTNNEAERSFRLLGTKKGVGIFRSIENAKEFCVIWSYLSTAKKHGYSYFTAVMEAFKGKSYELIFSKEGRNQYENNSPVESLIDNILEGAA